MCSSLLPVYSELDGDRLGNRSSSRWWRRLFCERVDRTQFAEGVSTCRLGVFEMSQGKIKEWRDYFDLDTFMRGRRA